jgi:hypothetical protein
MRSLSKSILAGALLVPLAFLGCSKKATEAAPPPAVEQAAALTNAPAAQSAQPAPAASAQQVQQVNANWDAVSKQIANQNYEQAVRDWIKLEQAQRQAQMNEAMRQAYERRFYQAREALRQRAETDPKAREAYQALGRAVTGR